MLSTLELQVSTNEPRRIGLVDFLLLSSLLVPSHAAVYHHGKSTSSFPEYGRSLFLIAT